MIKNLKVLIFSCLMLSINLIETTEKPVAPQEPTVLIRWVMLSDNQTTEVTETIKKYYKERAIYFRNLAQWISQHPTNKPHQKN